MSDVEISVVLPMYNERAVAEQALEAVSAELERFGGTFEIVCVDDGSTDGTAELLARAVELDARIRVVPLSRNFGKESALAAGLSVASGRAVVLMDADLQHPPELIPQMRTLWQQGYDVVSGVKQARARESSIYRSLAWLFNLLMGKAARQSFRGASDFKLLDRQVVDALLQCPERSRFFRGLVAWVGFRTVEVPFTVAERAAGDTKWSFLGLVRYSIRNLVAFSALPLRLVAVAGFVTLGFALALALQTLWRFLRGAALSGFTTVILLQLLLGGILLVSVGILALYVSELYEEVKQRPMFLVRQPRDPRLAHGAGERDALPRGGAETD